MGSLFRSKDMVRCQLILQSESAYDVIAQLGEIGVLHFCDVSEGRTADFRRIFASEIHACAEMERIIVELQEEVKEFPITPFNVIIDTPPPREYVSLHETLSKFESDLKVIRENFKSLNMAKTNLQRWCDTLLQTETFLEEAHVTVPLEDDQIDRANPETLGMPGDGDEMKQQLILSSLKLSILCGTVSPKKRIGFERMIWRASFGNCFFRHCPANNVFMIIVQGAELKSKCGKICSAFHATLFPFIANPEQRQDMVAQLKTELADMTNVIGESTQHRERLQADVAKDLAVWRTKVRKIKAIFYAMNLFNLNLSEHCLVGECWCPTVDLQLARATLKRAMEMSNADKPSLLLVLETTLVPPTFNKTNEFTMAFQAIVDAYGVANYKEVNPAVFTTITFPFLFGVMFGDIGHGLIMTCLALFIVAQRDFIISRNLHRGEMAQMIFGGRYIIMLMGLFSVYIGFMYNDCFGHSVNIFGSAWNAKAFSLNDLMYKDGEMLQDSEIESQEQLLDPLTGGFRTGQPYPFGIDPIWDLAESNKISNSNSYKMKMSVIFGVMQMSFGIILGCFNHAYRCDFISVFNQFVPRILFIWCLFGYLVCVIFYKWIMFDCHRSNIAPELTQGLINFFMFSGKDNDKAADGTEIPSYYYFANQKTIQTVLLLIAIISIPWMLFVIPIVKFCRQSKVVHEPVRKSIGSQADHDEHGFFDLFIHECIHTIEFCLGIISNTASYLRLWALSLAHSQLAEVLWRLVLRSSFAIGSGYGTLVAIFILFAAWAVLTMAILVFMEGMSAFLHALRLHWVEFQNKFYGGDGYLYEPFSFKTILELRCHSFCQTVTNPFKSF